jgi:hypothetical protein
LCGFYARVRLTRLEHWLAVLLRSPLSLSLECATAFACGIAFVNIVYPMFIFRGRGTLIGLASDSVFYVVNFLASETLLSGAIQWLELGPGIAGVFVAGVMIPANCFGGAIFLYSGEWCSGRRPVNRINGEPLCQVGWLKSRCRAFIARDLKDANEKHQSSGRSPRC